MKGPTLRVCMLAVAVCSLFVLWRSRQTPRAPYAEAGLSRELTLPAAAPAPPVDISGTVRRPDGVPVGGARVCATEADSQRTNQPRDACTETDTKGRYRVALDAGGYFLNAEAAGFAPAAAEQGKVIFLSPGQVRHDVDFVLSPGGARFAGVVVDATGGTIFGATIRVTRLGKEPSYTVSVASDREGRFVLWALPGALTWIAEAAGYAPVRGYRVAPTSDLLIQMTPASTMRGEVVSTQDGKRIPGVRVRAMPKGMLTAATSNFAVSDADGAFAIGGLDAAEYLLAAEGVGYRSQSNTAVQVGLADAVDHVVVKVTPVAQVMGKVLVSPTGQPCQQGTVAIGPAIRGFSIPDDPPYAKPEVTSSHVPMLDANIAGDGAVHFRAVPPGTYHVVVQCADRVLAEGPTSIDVGGENVSGLVWKVTEGLSLVVHFVDEGGQPAGGAEGRLRFPVRHEGDRASSATLVADAEGRSEYRGSLYPGTYTINAAGAYEADPVTVELREGMGKVDATLRLRGRGSILVRVRGSGGEPIDDVKVSTTAVNPSDAADAASARASGTAKTIPALALGDGRFRFGPLALGRYRIRVSDGVNPDAPGPDHDAIDVTGGGTVETTVTLERGGLVRGRVLDSSNQPAADVWVSADCEGLTEISAAESFLRHPPPGFAASVRRVLTDPQGRFTLGGISRSALCTLRAEQPFGSAALKHDVRANDEVVLSLPALGTLTGTALTAEGAPVERFMIQVDEPETNNHRTEEISAPGGRFSLAHVLPGALRVQGSVEGAFAMTSVELSPGQTRSDVSLQFRSLQDMFPQMGSP